MKRSLSVGVAAGEPDASGAAVVNEDVSVGRGEDSACEVQAESNQKMIAKIYEMDLIFESMV